MLSGSINASRLTLKQKARTHPRIEPVQGGKATQRSKYSLLAAYALFVSLLLQPVAPVFAYTESLNDEVSVLVTLPDESVTIDTPDEELSVATPESIDDDPPDSSIEGASDESDQVGDSSTLVFVEAEDVATTTVEDVADVIHDNELTTFDEPIADEVVDPDEAITTEQDVDEKEAPALDENLSDTVDDEVAANDLIASTTETLSSTSTATTTATYVINAENRYQFAERECRAIGDGAFYCRDHEDIVSVREDGVFAAPDPDGDLEIYVRVDGVESQLTYNTYEDSAPYYDPVSERVVWHALVNDRYQIFAYELNDDRLIQVTGGKENSMQPTAYGDDIFWQSWMHNNWEIMRFDGTNVTRVSNNAEPDIAPYAQDTYLMWQNEHGGVWRTALFDLSKGTVEYLDSLSEGIAKNPRLVLMYESYDQYGDMHMFGYDLKTKENIALSHTALPTPKELPKPDGEQEKRALVNAKPTIKDDGDEGVGEDDVPNPTATSTPDVSQSDDMTLVIPPLASSTIETSGSATEIFVPPALLSTTTVDHIEDLIIAPL